MIEQLADELATRLFPGAADTRLRLHIYRLLKLVDWRHLEFAAGPLSQALLLIVHDPVADVARVSLRLLMRAGAMHALSATGASSRIIECLPLIAGVLADMPDDHAASPECEQAIGNLPEGAGVVFTVERSGALLPTMPVGANMQCKLVLAGLNRLRQRHGLAPMEMLPEDIAGKLGAAAPHRHTAVLAYLRSLNQLALSYCNTEAVKPRSQLTVYNFLAAKEGRHCRNRLQALQVLPWLLPVLTVRVAEPRVWGVRPLEAGWPERIAQVQSAVDQGAPLFEAIAAVLQVPREAVRWLGRRELPSNWSFDLRRAGLLLRLLSWLPPERRPASAREFERLVRSGDAMLAPFRRICDSECFPDLGRPHYGSIVRRWLADLARSGGGGDEEQFEPMRLALVDTRDFLAAVHAAEIRHRRQQDRDADDEQVLVSLLDRLSGLSLRRVLVLSRAWHALVERLTSTADRDGERGTEALRWPLVLRQPWTTDGLLVTELGTARSLLEEGRAMQHCIGGYAEDCASGDSLVFSVRDADGNRLSTLELHLTDGGRQLVGGQHRSVGNVAPSSACDIAMAALLRCLSRDEYASDRSSRFSSQQQRRIQRQQHQHNLSASEAVHQQQMQEAAREVFWRGRPGAN